MKSRLFSSVLLCFATTAWATEPTSRPVTIDKERMDETQAFVIKCERDSSTCKVVTADEKTCIDISGSGIGGATIERKADRWPTKLVLRLHLRGLESLNIADGKLELATSVPSHGQNQSTIHLWKDGKEGPQLKADDPYWADMQTFDALGKPVEGLPIEGGWFELTIPKALPTEQSKTITLKWIDFYR